MTDEDAFRELLEKFGFRIEDLREAAKQEERIRELMRDLRVTRHAAIAGIVAQDKFRYE